MAFAPGTAQAIYQGQLQYFDSSTPSNLSAFCFFESDPLQRGEIAKRALRLTIVRQYGQGISLDKIKKSERQEVKLPATYDEFKTQVDYIEAAWEIISTKKSQAVEEIRRFKKRLDRTKATIKARLVTDKLFAAKVLFALDTRLQNHLEDCRLAMDRTEVDCATLNLEAILAKVKAGDFSMELPPSFHSDSSGGDSGEKTPQKRDLEINNLLKELENKNKRQRQGGKVVKNKEPIPGVALREGEDYSNVFAGKFLDDRPMWDDECRMCTRFHVKKYCFPDCPNKNSHKPNSKVPGKKRSEMQAFCQKCREA